MTKFKQVLAFILKFLNRLAPYAEVAIVWFCIDGLKEQYQDKSYFILFYAIPILMLYRVLKWEWICFKSKDIIKTNALNSRVQGFGGKQGAGKTSFMLYSLYVIHSDNIYTNFPCKIRGKYTYQLDNKVLNLDERIPDNSCCAISEATMLFHNIVSGGRGNVEETKDLYAQQLHQQIIRHLYDGNLFYDSVDLTRLPKMLKDNMGMTNFMLGQGSVKLSYFINPILNIFAKLLGFELSGSIRYWDLQQFEKIPEDGYTFDLSTQEKSTDLKHYANLLRISTWNSSLRFDYDDRFLRGLYVKLPEHVAKQWDSLKYCEQDLRDIGYGFLLEFFDEKLKR